MPCMLLIDNVLQGIVRKLFVPSSGLLWGFFANLRTACEEVANVPRLSLDSDPKKVKTFLQPQCYPNKFALPSFFRLLGTSGAGEAMRKHRGTIEVAKRFMCHSSHVFDCSSHHSSKLVPLKYEFPGRKCCSSHHFPKPVPGFRGARPIFKKRVDSWCTFELALLQIIEIVD